MRLLVERGRIKKPGSQKQGTFRQQSKIVIKLSTTMSFKKKLPDLCFLSLFCPRQHSQAFIFYCFHITSREGHSIAVGKQERKEVEKSSFEVGIQTHNFLMYHRAKNSTTALCDFELIISEINPSCIVSSTVRFQNNF